MKRILSITALSFSMVAFASAMAADGYVTGQVNMRAGPDTSYPSVTVLGTGTEVSIQGCVDGWSWCDVITGGNRGWVAGSYLQENYQGQRVLVPAYGVQIGIPIITFVFGTYWDDYYRNRPWYSQREHWSQVTPNYRPVAASDDHRRDAGAGSPDHGHGASASDAEPSRAAHAPAANEPRSSDLAAARPAQHAEPSATAARPVRQAATSSTVAAQHHAAPAERHVAQARVTAPHATASHAAPAARASRPASPERSAPKEEGGNDKSQH